MTRKPRIGELEGIRDSVLTIISKNHGCYGLRGSKNPNAKLKPEDRVKIKELHVKGISAREIRNKYFPNVCEETIRRTINQCLI
jgi:hypothetical protein